ncbi:MAG: cation diffusion facilitator family transporter [Leptospiraceae bacterium]|nr:cation diffusion facilitator family transporter [Leptospiraceae bacterium]MDW8307678.1 cation diffusion facilitator family transporter [Leptospiraceae bacterium]
MSHQHEHHSPIALAFWLNLSFAVIEILGGFYTNSMAILSDALHDLGDVFLLFLSWQLEKFSQRKPDYRYHYGYQRYSLLAALLTGVVLTVGAVLVLRESIPRLWEGSPVHVPGMVLLALLGVIVNTLAASRFVGKRRLNQKMIQLHLMEDVFGWLAVLAGALAMWYWNIMWVDPALAIGLNFFIIYNVYRNLKETVTILMQKAPAEVDTKILEKEISRISGVCDIHALYLWTLDGQEHILSLHVVIDKQYPPEKLALIKKKIREKLSRYHIHHATIEIEFKREKCESRLVPQLSSSSTVMPE